MHTKRGVNLIGNQEFTFAGKIINIHDVVSIQIENDKIKAIYVDNEGSNKDYDKGWVESI